MRYWYVALRWEIVFVFAVIQGLAALGADVPITPSCGDEMLGPPQATQLALHASTAVHPFGHLAFVEPSSFSQSSDDVGNELLGNKPPTADAGRFIEKAEFEKA